MPDIKQAPVYYVSLMMKRFSSVLWFAMGPTSPWTAGVYGRGLPSPGPEGHYKGNDSMEPLTASQKRK